MKRLRNTYLGLLTLIFGVICVPLPLEAQLRIPNIFNRDRDRDDQRPTVINRDTPDIEFVRNFGTPTPYPTKIETIKGYEVTFFIYAKTKTPGMRVEFLVRDFPTAGRLVSMVSNPENRSSVIVTYLADPNSGATMDSFSFAARYPGGKYSSTARCDIQIRDAQALIEVTSKADFGKVMVGKSMERKIMVTNRGNGPYNTTLNLSAPWKVISPEQGRLRVEAGRQFEVTVAFEPSFSGPSNYDLILNRSERGTCKFSGEGEIPFALTKDEWKLQYNPATGRREAHIAVVSFHDRPFEIFARATRRLHIEEREYMVLFPERENHILVYLEKDDVMAFDGGIEFKMREGYEELAAVYAETLPPLLEIEIPGQLGQEVINFGQVIAGRSAERGIILKNIGGELMAPDVSVPEPFRVLTKTDRQLVPLDSMPVSIGFYPHKSDRGAADQVLTLRNGTQQIPIRLVGNALRPPGAPREKPKLKPKTYGIVPSNPPTPPTQDPTSNPDPDPVIGNGGSTLSNLASPDRLKAAPLSRSSIGNNSIKENKMDLSVSPFMIVTKSLVERERAPGLKSAEDFELLKAKADRLEFGWTAPKGSEIDDFELEMRGQMINPITSMLESVWAPYPDVEYKRVGRLVKAKVNGLTPNTFYEFRVFTIDQNGRTSPPSAFFGTKTIRTMDWTYIYVILGLVVLGLLGWGIVKIVRDRRGEVYHSEFVD